MRVMSKKTATGVLSNALKDGYCQGIATTLYVLHMTYGYGDKRMKRIIEEIQSLIGNKWGGRRLEVHQLDTWLQEQYNIDLENDISLQFKIRKKQEGAEK